MIRLSHGACMVAIFLFLAPPASVQQLDYAMAGYFEGMVEVQAYKQGEEYVVELTCRWKTYETYLVTYYLHSPQASKPFSFYNERAMDGGHHDRAVIPSSVLEARNLTSLTSVEVVVRNRNARTTYNKFFEFGVFGGANYVRTINAKLRSVVTEYPGPNGATWFRAQTARLDNSYYPNGTLAHENGIFHLCKINGSNRKSLETWFDIPENRCGKAGGGLPLTMCSEIHTLSSTPDAFRLVSTLGARLEVKVRPGDKAAVLEALIALTKALNNNVQVIDD